MSIFFAAPNRAPTAIYDTILESVTHGDGSRLGHFHFYCLYEKWKFKEKSYPYYSLHLTQAWNFGVFKKKLK